MMHCFEKPYNNKYEKKDVLCKSLGFGLNQLCKYLATVLHKINHVQSVWTESVYLCLDFDWATGLDTKMLS